MQAVLEEEIQRLPEKHRLPFVLCHLQGLSRAEAGRQLGLKEGTVWSRLAQARLRLQKRLSRRGIALTAGARSAGRIREGSACGPGRGGGARARQSVAGLLTDAVSVRVAMLAQVGMQTMTGKMKLVLMGLVLMVGAGGVVCHALMAQPLETPAALEPAAKIAAQPKNPPTPQVRTDRHGDPLPKDALARLGTVRWRHGFFASALAYSPDGKKIAAVGCGRAITLWDAVTGKEVCQFPNRGQPIGLAFSPDGKILATTGTPCQLWEVATGKELRQLTGHANAVRSIAFSPDGKRVATASADASIRLWDPATGTELRRLDSGSGEVCRLALCGGRQVNRLNQPGRRNPPVESRYGKGTTPTYRTQKGGLVGHVFAGRQTIGYVERGWNDSFLGRGHGPAIAHPRREIGRIR